MLPIELLWALPDGEQITVVCSRSSRARRLRLSVDGRGARLTLPLGVSQGLGLQFLEEHEGWLAKHWQRCKPQGDELGLRRGETGVLPLWGEMLPVVWHEGRYSHVEQEADGLHFYVPVRAGDAAMRRALLAFYEAQGRALVGRLLPQYLSGLPKPPLRIRWKVVSSLWGSLNAKGVMTLDVALVLGRAQALEYVLVHELCHLLVRNHSLKFWGEVEQRFASWREERGYLKDEGRKLKVGLQGLLKM